MLSQTVEKTTDFVDSGCENLKFSKQEKYCLSKIQHTIWLESSGSKDISQNNSLLMKIDSWIDLQRLKEAFVKALDNHPSLFSRIILNNEKTPYLKRYDSDGFTTESIEEIHEESKGIDEIKGNLGNSFELVDNRLFRIKIVFSKGIYVFVEVHSIICDVSSLYIFMENVSKAYLGYELDKEILDGYDSNLFENKLYTDANCKLARKYYSDLLNEIDKNCLPKNDLNIEETIGRFSLELVSRRCITDMVRSFCQNNSFSMNGFFCAAFGFLLAKYNFRDNSIFNTVYDGRNNSLLKNTVSVLNKYFPVVAEIKGKEESKSIVEFIKNIDNQLLNARNNDVLSFSEVQKEFGIKSDILFCFLGENYNFNSFCGKISKPIDLSVNQISNKLLFNVSLHGAEVTYDIDSDKNFYGQVFMDYFLDAFDMVVSEFMTKKFLEDVETTSYKTVKAIREFKVSNIDKEIILSDVKRDFSDLSFDTNMKIYVLDSDKKLLPPGAIGKLYFSCSDKNRLNISEQIIIKNPFSNDSDHDKLFYTGYNARWLSDGKIDLL